MSDKWQTLHNFWSGFGIPAYDQASVPDNAVMPYITYTAVTAPFENVILISGDIWYNSSSWGAISQKADDIGRELKGHKLMRVNTKEYLMLAQGSPFAQRIYDTDDTVKRVHINVMGEYLTYF